MPIFVTRQWMYDHRQYCSSRFAVRERGPRGMEVATFCLHVRSSIGLSVEEKESGNSFLPNPLCYSLSPGINDAANRALSSSRSSIS